MPLTPKQRTNSADDRGTAIDYSAISSNSSLGPTPKQQPHQDEHVGSILMELAAYSLQDSSHQSDLNSEAEPSCNIILPLRRYQKEWLKWGLDQEASDIKGGILYDESGLGRKIQVISLAVTARDHNLSVKSEGSSSLSGDHNRCTLVICNQQKAQNKWRKEINSHTVNVRYLLYDVAEGPTTVDFSNYDFVITTFHTIRSNYKRQFHRSENETSSKRIKKEKKTTRTNPSATSGKSLLYSERWERIILDEVKIEVNTLKAKAVYALDSKYKWALISTPLQNIDRDQQDLHALICFLKLFPCSYYHCVDCACTKHENDLLFDFLGRCFSQYCMHHISRHFIWWTKYITEKIKDKESAEEAKLLYNEEVLKKVLFRGTKSE